MTIIKAISITTFACFMALSSMAVAQDGTWYAPTWGDAGFSEDQPIAYVEVPRGSIYVQLKADGLEWKTTIIVPSQQRNVHLRNILKNADGSSHTLDTKSLARGILQDPHDSGGLITTFSLDQEFVDRAKAADSWTVLVGLDRFVFPMSGSRVALQHVEDIGHETLHVIEQEKSDIEQAINNCGYAAAHPNDQQSPFPGVAWNDIDIAEAVSRCEWARETLPESPQVAYWLGRAYDKAQDQRSRDALMAAAEGGYFIAYNHLGVLSRDGEYGPVDIADAKLMFRKGAEGGNYLSQYNLARLLQEHEGETARAEALENLESSALADYTHAQVLLAQWYRDGTMSDPDPISAIDLFGMAIETGSSMAAYELAEIYRDGNGVDPDPRAYLRYLKVAAEMGHSEARKELGED
ncbi:tetratricopeptide repeat protein [uncultured Shimia sp.]|uniref:tetratricopeptide repeat protein n=1 Tax=uncultured Shimia sp. TaxID=573152 RepID=UPI00262933B7|nr:tetratricopeptide repeat protein [uncultured Shimia sp.]